MQNKKRKIIRKADNYLKGGKRFLRKRKGKRIPKNLNGYNENVNETKEDIPWQIKELENAHSIHLGQMPSDKVLTDKGVLNVIVHRKFKNEPSLTFETNIYYESKQALDILYYRFIELDTKYKKESYLSEIIINDSPQGKKLPPKRKPGKYVKTPIGFIKQEIKGVEIKKTYKRKILVTDYRGITQRRMVRIHII
jgi:hypothetical protein